MRTLLLCLALPLLTWGADDDAWAKLRDVKSGAEIRVYKIGAAQPLAVKMGELTDENLVIGPAIVKTIDIHMVKFGMENQAIRG